MKGLPKGAVRRARRNGSLSGIVAARLHHFYLETMRRPRAFRIWALVWAVLQFALPAAASLADARLEQVGSVARAHVESSSSATCHAVHSENCALCQVLGQTASPAESPRSPDVARELPLPVVATRVERDSRTLALLAPARAPPSV